MVDNCRMHRALENNADGFPSGPADIPNPSLKNLELDGDFWPSETSALSSSILQPCSDMSTSLARISPYEVFRKIAPAFNGLRGFWRLTMNR